MDIKQAINNVTLVVRQFRGTAEEHEALAMSLAVIRKAIEATEPKPEVEMKKDDAKA